MRVDFYLIRDAKKSAEQLCCQLCAKAFSDEQQLAVLCNDQQQSKQVDTMLWQRPAQRFIPHGLATSEAAHKAMVVIGAVDEHTQMVVNLGHALPELPVTHQVQRILDIVPNSEAARSAARERYRQYRQMGADLHSHELG
jgi:DNA polymerase-3 subunit chi